MVDILTALIARVTCRENQSSGPQAILESPFITLMAWTLLDERLKPLALIEMVVCVVGVASVNWRIARAA